MSGGPEAPSPGGGFGQDTGGDCASLRYDALLSSASADAAAKLEVGEVLEISLRTAPTRAIVASRTDGEYVGSITKRVRELLRCLQQQVSFIAAVTNVSGGDVWVRIMPR